MIKCPLMQIIHNELFKGTVQLETKFWSFTHSHFVANLYDFLSSARHKGLYFEMFQLFLSTGSNVDFHCVDK